MNTEQRIAEQLLEVHGYKAERVANTSHTLWRGPDGKVVTLPAKFREDGRQPLNYLGIVKRSLNVSSGDIRKLRQGKIEMVRKKESVQKQLPEIVQDEPGPKQANTSRVCAHVLGNHKQCKNPAERGHRFCYQHRTSTQGTSSLPLPSIITVPKPAIPAPAAVEPPVQAATSAASYPLASTPPIKPAFRTVGPVQMAVRQHPVIQKFLLKVQADLDENKKQQDEMQKKIEQLQADAAKLRDQVGSADVFAIALDETADVLGQDGINAMVEEFARRVTAIHTPQVPKLQIMQVYHIKQSRVPNEHNLPVKSWEELAAMCLEAEQEERGITNLALNLNDLALRVISRYHLSQVTNSKLGYGVLWLMKKKNKSQLLDFLDGNVVCLKEKGKK